ncbi:MAG TPA: glycosyltransferase [Candidatus Acidoferrum sp.]|nr:glycosyltransferase [Candidatus Acidoferrum sp.]
MNRGVSSLRTVLIYEPRVEGHHLVWLKFIAEDLLSAGWKLTLALDNRAESAERIHKRLGPLLESVSRLPVWDAPGRRVGGDGVQCVAACFSRARTELVFLNSFDEIASSVLRRAALGRLPPATLRGRMGGIYLRPRFLAGRGVSPNEWLKHFGFARLMRGGWLTHLLFLDPWIQADCQARFPQTPAFCLPDPCPDDFVADRQTARTEFEIPAGWQVLLFYGGPYRRKGLHLAVEALLGLSPKVPVFLLCAGQQENDSRLQRGLQTLVQEGRARVIRRYIYEAEEKKLFAASDIVLLPYLKHFGNSAVLSRAAGAGKMVIASDEQLVGRLVREHRLGLLFPSGNPAALRRSIEQAAGATPEMLAQWQAAALRYAAWSSRAEFRRVLLQSFERAAAGAHNPSEPTRPSILRSAAK